MYLFIIEDTGWNSSLSPVTFTACYKKFVDFQIDLFVKTDSFPLRTINCRYSVARRDDTYFDYDDNFLEIYYDNSDENDSNSNSKEQINSFVSSVCYTEMRTNLVF